MTHIVDNRIHFDFSNENTSDEEKFVLSKLKITKKRALISLEKSKEKLEEKSKEKMAEEEDGSFDLASLGLKVMKPLVVCPSTNVDDFTHFVRHTLALKIFGDVLPTDPPKSSDPPDLVADLTLLQAAVVGSKRFRENELYTHISALFDYVKKKFSTGTKELQEFHVKMLECSELEVKLGGHMNHWTGRKEENLFTLSLLNKDKSKISVDKAQQTFLLALHNIYHLQYYICSAIIEELKDESTAGKSYIQVWTRLVEFEGRGVNISVSDWDETMTFNKFIDALTALYKVWMFTKK